MLQIFLFCLLTSILAPVLAGQVSLKLGSDTLWQEEPGKGIPIIEESRTEWNLHTLPHPNDTDHLVFETVYSLLQLWPNTRMRNGK